MDDQPRLIEHAFPLKQASLDSVHEKNVRHGHISTLHIWPARRPLAACRAALIATLLPDPGTPEKRKELCEKFGGKVVKKLEKKRMPNGQIVEREKEVTEGGILHWGRETENKELLDWFRTKIREAYGGRAPKVLDPFAGGGAIPLEAMRLGCEATAIDINPVAWFILKCTLEYPQRLAGKTHPLPEFILENEEFMDEFYKAHPHLVGRTKKTKKQLDEEERQPGFWDKPDSGRIPKADLAWHVRAWGHWVLNHSRKELARYYPVYADFEPLDKRLLKPYEKQPMRMVPLKEDGTQAIDALNADFSKEYFADKRNPRWVAKTTVAYLWARTVTCKNCRAIIPLLKTRWLCKKEKKRVLLTMVPNIEKTTVFFGIETNVPMKGGNKAQCREYDKRIGGGTMSRSGAKCPCCGAIMTMEDLRLENQSRNVGSILTAVVIDGPDGKEYRLPTDYEIKVNEESELALSLVFKEIPFGIPNERILREGPGASYGFPIIAHGINEWRLLFTPCQLLSIGTFMKWTRSAKQEIMNHGYNQEWGEAILSQLAIGIDKLADRQSALCRWDMGYSKVNSTFVRFALPILWDYCQGNPLSNTTGNYGSCVEWVVEVIEHVSRASENNPKTSVIASSAIQLSLNETYDVVLTDPPYYDAIPYSDLMDFFYVWLKRTLNGISPHLDSVFSSSLSPKWNTAEQDGELIDDASRHGGDKAKSKAAYEYGMSRVFQTCNGALNENGILVIVFAHKKPDAWETLASAIIKAGFVVDGSWPVQTEMVNRTRSHGSAALSSSVWLVCKKRSPLSKPGWDNLVLEAMKQNIRVQLREFWDAGIRGPDFVWAATGPALEAYSKHPVVKKANDPGQVMLVSEFLSHVRRIVVDFVVGRVLSGDGEGEADVEADRLDEPTAYYLLHRHDFGLDEAPAGACILYAISCGISDKELASTWDLIGFTKGKSSDEADDEESDAETDADADVEEDSGSKVKLKTWIQRKGRSLGYDSPGGKPIPLIDRVHRLMHLWKTGELAKVDEYLDDNGLRRQELFKRLLQSLIELSPHGSEERSLLESLSNHVGARGAPMSAKLFSLEESGE